MLDKLKRILGIKKEEGTNVEINQPEPVTKVETKEEVEPKVEIKEEVQTPVKEVEVKEEVVTTPKETETVIEEKAEPQVEETQEMDEIFGESLDVKGVGDEVEVSVVSVEPTYYNAQIKDNAQTVIIEKDQVDEPLFLGEEITVKIFRRFDDDLYARPVVKETVITKDNYTDQNHFMNVISSLSVGDIITAEVVDYNEPFFKISYNGTLINLLEYRIDCPPLLPPDSYLGKTYDFKVVEIKENKKNGAMYVEVSRKELALAQRLEDIKKYKVGDKITMEFYNANNGGIESRYNDVRTFVPYAKLTDNAFVNIDNVDEFIKMPLELEVMNIMDDTLICFVPGIEQKVDNTFFDEDHVGEKVTGKIVKIFDYGVLIKLESGHKGLLHFRELDADQIKDVKAKELFEEMEVEIISVNKDKQQINFTIA